MTYKTHRERLKRIMHSYVLYMLECQDPDDVNKISAELQRIKDEMYIIDKMTESQLHEQRLTISLTVESRIKHLKSLNL